MKTSIVNPLFYQDQSNQEIAVDHLADLTSLWERWRLDNEELDGKDFPGYVYILEQYLEAYNYHDMMGLPNAFFEIVSHTPLPAEDKQILLQRLCNAVYNMDIL